MDQNRLQEVIATRVKHTWPYSVHLPKSPPYEELDEWCKLHIRNNYRIVQHPFFYVHLNDEADAIMFMLRWGSYQ